MEALDLLLSRQSHNKLIKPGPDEKQLALMFKAALRAPDHALLKPWRYRVYSGDSLKLLAEHFAAALKKSDPEVSPEKLEKHKSKPLRAPMVIVASVVLQEHPKVPHIEQILSAGASVQNLIQAAHFQNIGAIWRTGDMAFNTHFTGILEFAEGEIVVGFIYLGTVSGEKRKLKAIQIDDFVTRY